MMKQTLETTIEPVRKELKVNLSAEAAFRLFTEGLDKWWPLVTHSVGEEKAESCFFEGRVGGVTTAGSSSTVTFVFKPG